MMLESTTSALVMTSDVQRCSLCEGAGAGRTPKMQVSSRRAVSCLEPQVNLQKLVNDPDESARLRLLKARVAKQTDLLCLV
jgi:hypothetical protein